MVLGALTHSSFSLANPLLSEDTRATLDALYSLGTEFRSTTKGVAIHCEALKGSRVVIDARNSGTTIRLITGVASLLPSTTTLTGDESLVRRPMGPLVDALSQLGAKISYHSTPGRPPISVTGPITGDRADIPANISSQFVSSLLIACSQKKGDTQIRLEGELRSRPYVDITLQMLQEFGARAAENEEGFFVEGEQRLSREAYTVPGDYSSAAFPLAAAAISGGDVTVRSLDKASPQGDRAFLDHLKAFGAKVTRTDGAVRVESNDLCGTDIDVKHTPDLFPILAVIGAIADGETVLSGGENLKDKESDRIATTVRFLHDMGAAIVPKSDGCEIKGVQKLRGANVKTEGDHRILMAAAVAALAASSETVIDDTDSFNVSYPGFVRDLHQLGCRVAVRK